MIYVTLGTQAKDFSRCMKMVEDLVVEANIKDKVVGEEVIKKVSSGQMIVKIIDDELLKLLGEGSCEVNLESNKPLFIMVAGLQGTGKTTSVAKLAKRLKIS